MRIELGIFLKQDATLPDDQRRRHGNNALTVPAGLRYAIVMFLCIKEYLRAALRAKNNAGEQIGKCLKPLFFGHAFIWRGQTNCKGLYKKIADDLRIQLPIDDDIVLISLDGAIALVIRIIDENRVLTV